MIDVLELTENGDSWLVQGAASEGEALNAVVNFLVETETWKGYEPEGLQGAMVSYHDDLWWLPVDETRPDEDVYLKLGDYPAHIQPFVGWLVTL